MKDSNQVIPAPCPGTRKTTNVSLKPSNGADDAAKYTYATCQLGPHRHFTASFEGFDTEAPLFVFETQSPGRARRAVEALVGKAAELKPWFALVALAHADRWWVIEDLPRAGEQASRGEAA